MLPLTVYLNHGGKFGKGPRYEDLRSPCQMRGKAPGVKLNWQDEGRVWRLNEDMYDTLMLEHCSITILQHCSTVIL